MAGTHARNPNEIVAKDDLLCGASGSEDVGEEEGSETEGEDSDEDDEEVGKKRGPKELLQRVVSKRMRAAN